jgi:site-specific recombinase XerD
MSITPLRQRMLDTLQIGGYSSRTAETYLYAVKNLSRYYQLSPDQISPEQIQAWLLWMLKEKHLSASTCRLNFNGVRFFFVKVLNDANFQAFSFTLPKAGQRFPELLTQHEVAHLFLASPKRQRTLLRSCYGCGLRLNELVKIRPQDINAEQLLLHVVQGKGAKDRFVPIPPTLLPEWRSFWCLHSSKHWLFPRAYKEDTRQHLSGSALQKIYTRAKRLANIQKKGGIHALRHAFATHSLTLGLPIQQLQGILGHKHLNTTLRYLHFLQPNKETPSPDLLNSLEELSS